MADDARETTCALPALWPWLLLCAAVAGWVNLGTFHRHHHADSLVPILVSLQRWTPFIWCQDRMGMLVPLLALPFQSPLANLLVQGTLHVFAALTAGFLLARYVLPDRTYPLVGALSAAGFLALAPPAWVFDFTANTFYGLWLALGLGGLLLAERRPGERALPRWRGLLALLLLVLAHWVFAAAAFVLVPLVIARRLCGDTSPPAHPPDKAARRRRGALVPALPLALLGFAAGFLLMRLVHIACRTGLGTLPPGQWWGTWEQLAINAWADLTPSGWPVLLAGMAAAGGVWLLFPALRRRAARAWRAAAVLAAAGVGYFLLMGTREWMALNSFCARYTRPTVFLLHGALLVAGVAPLCAVLPARIHKSLGTLTPVLLLLAAASAYGYPSLQGVRAQLDRTLGACTNDILAARCTHVAGNYWRVWPAVFHANLALYEQGRNAEVWGITIRCEETLRRWRDMPREAARIAVAAGGDADADPYLSATGFPELVVAEKRPTVWVLRPPASSGDRFALAPGPSAKR
jgi:hypothetical protein